MKAKVIRTGFAFGRLVEPGEVIEVSQPASWYRIVEEAPKAEPVKAPQAEPAKIKPAKGKAAAPAPAGDSDPASLV